MERCCLCIPLRAGVFIIALLLSLVWASEVILLVVHKKTIFDYFPDSSPLITPVYYTCIAAALLYCLGGLFGLVGSLAQNRPMASTFSVINWTLVTLELISSFSAWVYLLEEKDNIINDCVTGSPAVAQNGTTSSTSSPPSANVNITGASNTSSYPLRIQVSSAAACAGDVQKVIIVMGVIVFVGNLISLYFASVVGAYATRLKRNNQHHKLRDLDAPIRRVPVAAAVY